MTIGTIIRGTVISVDHDAQLVRAQLVGGEAVIPATFTDLPPWPGRVASFQEVSPGKWVVVGTQGKREGLGPNVVVQDERQCEEDREGGNAIV